MEIDHLELSSKSGWSLPTTIPVRSVVQWEKWGASVRTYGPDFQLHLGVHDPIPREFELEPGPTMIQ
jgi:hypothetical protein